MIRTTSEQPPHERGFSFGQTRQEAARDRRLVTILIGCVLVAGIVVNIVAVIRQVAS